MEQVATRLQTNFSKMESVYREPVKTCIKCGDPIEKDIEILGGQLRVPIVCTCRKEELEKARLHCENEEKQRRLDNIFKNSLMDEKFKDTTFESWNHEKANEKIYSICFKYAENFKEAKKNNLGLIIHGEPGNGKSHATACIANYLLANYIPVICVSTNSLLERIKATYNSWGKEAEETVLRNLANADLLIIDDLGTEQDTEWGKTRIYNIIDSRYRNELPTIITMNLKMKDLEEKYGRRTYDRILEMCTPVRNEWGSIRVEKGKEKTKILKSILN